MTDSTLDTAPADELELIFSLPEEIRADPTLVRIYTEIRTRLQREASGLPMNTVQQLLLERISFTYVLMKFKEQNGGFARTNEQKDFYAFWQTMTAEFNKLMLANKDELRDALINKIIQIVEKSISQNVTDAEERKAVRRMLSEEFAAIDL